MIPELEWLLDNAVEDGDVVYLDTSGIVECKGNGGTR